VRLAPLVLSIVLLGIPGKLEAAKPARRAASASDGIHKVKRGETAAKVARAQGLSLGQLAALNPGVNLSRLSVGDSLRVKGGPELKVAKAMAEELPPGPVQTEPTVPVPPIPAIRANGPVVLVHLERLLPTHMEGAPLKRSARLIPPMSSQDLEPLFPAASGLEYESQVLAELGFEPADPNQLDLLWPVATRSISSSWGPRMRTRIVRVVKASNSRKVRVKHKGVDLTAPMGSDVYAAQAGRVIVAERHPQYGNYVVLDHGNGVQTAYAHHRVNLVQVGDIVQRGQKLAEVGTTGRSTGPHLHFELRLQGQHQNPLPLLNDAEEIPAEMIALNETIKGPRQ
jgi:murein DD-endopeptidase MepM/ murein hydrolase activator NlpD